MQELKLENSLVDGRYEVRERLSRGSYAEIYIARDREANGMEIVIKALNTSLQGTPDAELERTLVENFQNEAIALDTVRHPNVILRWGHGTAADLRGVPFHYLVLEYMPGGDLLKLCRKRLNNALPFDEALFYFKQACEALAYAHSKGIIHRDLKPNNFLLTADQRTLKIADFGVAKITTGEDMEITRVGGEIYAPPEHHPDELLQFSRLTASADIYSLAKSFYTVVCGRPPNQFKCDPITYLPGELMREPWGEPLTDVLCRATDDDPTQRHVTIIEFWNDLAQVAEIKKDESVDEETIVRPRLNVSPGALPKKPLLPDFDPALASSASQAAFISATPFRPRIVSEDTPIQTEPLPQNRRDGRPSKFIIELQKPKTSPAVQTQMKYGPPANNTETRPESKTPIKTETKPVVRNVASRFTENLRRRTFIVLLVLALTGLLASVFHYVRGKGIPFGFGPATEIEVITEKMHIRSGPSSSDSVLGIVKKNSRHRVREQNVRGWMQIEVREWDESEPHVTDQNSGWVYSGNPDYIRVVSRRWW